MEISDAQLKRLLHAPWLARADAESKTTYLMKFCADPEEVACWVLITDTKRVWAEVVHGRHISRRMDQLQPPNADRTNKQELRFRRAQLDLLNAAHNLGQLADMEISVENGGERADLSVTVTTPSLTWRWDAFALRPSHALEVLSQHLFLPMVSLTSVVVGLASGGGEWDDIQKQLDKTSKTARITLHTHVRALFTKPVVACGLARISQIWAHVPEEDLHPIVQDLEEVEVMPLDFGAPLSEDEPEPVYETAPEVVDRDYGYPRSNSPVQPLRSSPAPLPSDANGSATEDEDDDDAGETQIQTQVSAYTGASRYGASRYDTQSQVSVARGVQPQASRYGAQSQSQSQSQRPSMVSARSQPQPSHAQLSMVGAGVRSKSQPQPQQSQLGQKRAIDDSDSDEDERAEELRRRMFGATGGGIGKKRRAGRKF